MRCCGRCLLPELAPGADLDAAGICALCRTYDPSRPDAAARRRLEYERDLEAALAECRGKGPHDVLVCLSGGKDSIYLLHRAAVDNRGVPASGS